jgi:hypothetical protein
MRALFYLSFQEGRMKVVCAWHKEYFPSEPEKVIKENDLPGGISYGICDECRILHTKEYDRAKKARKLIDLEICISMAEARRMVDQGAYERMIHNWELINETKV